MPGLFVFLIKVNIALLIFCAGYYLVLRQLTFYTLNRIYLATAILFASVYPRINLTGFFEQHRHIAGPVQTIVYNFRAPAKELMKPLARHDYWQWAVVVFWLGVAVFAVRLAIQFISLSRIYKNSKAGKIYGHDVRLIKGISGPFSFWKNIYINPEMHEPADITSILLHEQVHVSELHTLDILLAEFSAIFYWFNPGIWMMKKAIRENVEFITDRKILQNGIDTKQYQYSLVNVSFSATPQRIVNHFNISTIKKRIIMMNAKRSSKINLTRYAFLVPAVAVMLLVFSISKAALVKKHLSAHKALVAEKKQAIGYDNASAKNGTVASVLPVSGKTKDTLRNGGFFLSTNEHTDSLKYVINGVKATKADFKALDPDHIFSVNLVSAEQANTLLNETGNRHGVLFVTTNDSESGKKFKEKIDYLTGAGNRSVSGAGAITFTATGGDSNNEGGSYSVGTTATSGSDLAVVEVAPKLYKVRPMKSRPLRLKDTLAFVTNNTPVATELYTEPDTIGISNIKIGKGAYNLTSLDKTQDKIYVSKGLTYTYKKPVKINLKYTTQAFKVYTTNHNDANIEHLSAKLIMIDGKEATERELKKLSAAEIESMSVKTGDDITKKYGDKAKNGIVFITTKKGDK